MKNKLQVRLSSLLFLSVIFLTILPAQARELQGRFGIGYNSQFANAYPNSTTAGAFRFPGISIKYAMNRAFAVELIGGIATTTPSNSVLAAKIFQNVFYENQLNFYFMGGFGLLSLNNTSATQFIAGLGVEFFIPGVDSLGLSVETGVSFDNVTGDFAIRTMGVSFLDAGIHFYF